MILTDKVSKPALALLDRKSASALPAVLGGRLRSSHFSYGFLYSDVMTNFQTVT